MTELEGQEERMVVDLTEEFKEAPTETPVEGKVEAATAPAEKPATPEDIASTFYTLFHAKFAQGLNNLSNKDLRRVLSALVEVPLLRTEHGITNENAKNVYLWADQLVKSKTMMELTVLHASGILDKEPETIDSDSKLSHTESSPVTSNEKETYV